MAVLRVGVVTNAGGAGMDGIQPIVLVGGRSRRFGRDKLREPFSIDGSEWLIDRPIAALRAVFGHVVRLVGLCDPILLVRADGVIPDVHPGAGPIGGIVSALAAVGPIFVLPGDLPSIDPMVVRRIRDAAANEPGAWAVLARSELTEPCVGIYRSAALPQLQANLAESRHSLHDALPPERVLSVPCEPRALINANVPADLLATRAEHRRA